MALVLSILALPVLASEDTLAARFPKGATAYLEVRGLAARVQQALDSPLGASLREHPAVQAFLASPKGRQLIAGEMMLRGATGYDLKGLLEAVASRELAIATYGAPQRYVAMARMEPEAIDRLLMGAEILSGQKRQEILAAADGRPALWQLGPAYVLRDGDLLVLSADQLLATAIRDRSAEGLAASDSYREARSFVSEDALLFATADLAPFRAQLEQGGKPKDLGQAFFLGALVHYVPRAPWAAIGIDVKRGPAGWSLTAEGIVPAPVEPPSAVTEAYAGTLGDLPFMLPEHTIGVLRMKRDLGSIWSDRDALIDERGIPKMIEFETNFGNLTGGLSWVEEFLPALGGETILVASRRTYAEGEAVPAVRYPQAALLTPFEGGEDLATRLQVAYFSAIGLVNLQAGQMKTPPLVPSSEEYQGVRIYTSRYMPPSEGEMQGHRKLPARYNVAPSLAVVDGYLVLASTDGILKELIDGRGGATKAPLGVNAGLWLQTGELRAVLAENRESLIAKRMLEEGESRDQAAGAVDFALELARHVHGFSLTMDESRAALGVTLRASFGAAEE